tara:strand:- start:5268 stop:6458 length:1191 start_codon:yes stop_codon:yes gene_type:complete
VKNWQKINAWLILWLALTGFVRAEKGHHVEGDRTIHTPVTHDNLSVFIISGPDTLGKDVDYVTLAEGMEKKWVVVHETGNVNQLAVENVTKNRTVVILSGAVVKGGKQDRVLSQDLVLQPESGKVPIASFCVEESRWANRGKESLYTFSANSTQVSGKGLRKAVKGGLSQGQVWKQVASEQMKISANVNANVQLNASPSSYQLAVENKELKKEIEAYKQELSSIIEKYPDAVGYAVTINGEFSTADVYASRKLFRKTWGQHLESAITEAVSLKNKAKKDQKIDLSWRDELFNEKSYEEKQRQKTGGANDYLSEQNKKFFRYNCLLKGEKKVSLRWSFERREEGESLEKRQQGGELQQQQLNIQSHPIRQRSFQSFEGINVQRNNEPNPEPQSEQRE